MSSHLGSSHEEETVALFMVHHEEEKNGGEFEMDPAIWNVLLSEHAEGALTEEEKKINLQFPTMEN